jgi:hypothetical protein
LSPISEFLTRGLSIAIIQLHLKPTINPSPHTHLPKFRTPATSSLVSSIHHPLLSNLDVFFLSCPHLGVARNIAFTWCCSLLSEKRIPQRSEQCTRPIKRDFPLDLIALISKHDDSPSQSSPLSFRCNCRFPRDSNNSHRMMTTENDDNIKFIINVHMYHSSIAKACAQHVQSFFFYVVVSR